MLIMKEGKSKLKKIIYEVRKDKIPKNPENFYSKLKRYFCWKEVMCKVERGV